jgi:hypothetical protein
MILKFPNARLYMQDLLATEKVSGAAALARAACQFGLLDVETMDNLIASNLQSGSGCCLHMSEQVLKKYFTQRPGTEQDVSTNVWQIVEKDALTYEKTVLKKGEHSCERLAPALFDLMLQHIRRYP